MEVYMGFFDKFKKKQNDQDYRKLNEEEYYFPSPSNETV
jgi:hypothetical protein